MVVIGPSGSGKTTLLRNLNFLEHADQGTMQFLDQTIDLAKPTKEQQQWVRRHTAMVFQNYNLFKNKTAVQNIAEGLIYGQGIERGEAVKKHKWLLPNWDSVSELTTIRRSYLAVNSNGLESPEPRF